MRNLGRDVGASAGLVVDAQHVVAILVEGGVDAAGRHGGSRRVGGAGRARVAARGHQQRLHVEADRRKLERGAQAVVEVRAAPGKGLIGKHLRGWPEHQGGRGAVAGRVARHNAHQPAPGAAGDVQRRLARDHKPARCAAVLERPQGRGRTRQLHQRGELRARRVVGKAQVSLREHHRRARARAGAGAGVHPQGSHPLAEVGGAVGGYIYVFTLCVRYACSPRTATHRPQTYSTSSY